jgi:hypothetical protein
MTDPEDAAMLNDQEHANGPQLKPGPLMASAVLIGTGAALTMAGLAIGGSHLFQAVRRWVRTMEVPPSERAKIALAQAKAAAAAGAEAWQKAPADNHRAARASR